MTGCLDQQVTKFVWIDDRTPGPVADLPADGYPAEAFAKHLGQRVTVRGTSIPGGPPPIFEVRSIETVNDVCATPEEQQ